MEEEQDIKEEHPYLSQPLCYTSLTVSHIIPLHRATVTPHEISRLLRIYPHDKPTPHPPTPTPQPTQLPTNLPKYIYLPRLINFTDQTPAVLQSAGFPPLRQLSETKIRPKLTEVTVNLS